MVKRDWGAGDRRQPTPSAIDDSSPDILTTSMRLGNCASCGIRIDVTAGSLRCPTCAAWRRWFSAHRLASQELREARE